MIANQTPCANYTFSSGVTATTMPPYFRILYQYNIAGLGSVQESWLSDQTPSPSSLWGVQFANFADMKITFPEGYMTASPVNSSFVDNTGTTRYVYAQSADAQSPGQICFYEGGSSNPSPSPWYVSSYQNPAPTDPHGPSGDDTRPITIGCLARPNMELPAVAACPTSSGKASVCNPSTSSCTNVSCETTVSNPALAFGVGGTYGFQAGYLKYPNNLSTPAYGQSNVQTPVYLQGYPFYLYLTSDTYSDLDASGNVIGTYTYSAQPTFPLTSSSIVSAASGSANYTTIVSALNNSSWSPTTQMKDSTGALIYYQYGLEYSQGKYLRGATQACLAGYTGKDVVLASASPVNFTSSTSTATASKASNGSCPSGNVIDSTNTYCCPSGMSYISGSSPATCASCSTSASSISSTPVNNVCTPGSCPTGTTASGYSTVCCDSTSCSTVSSSSCSGSQTCSSQTTFCCPTGTSILSTANTSGSNSGICSCVSSSSVASTDITNRLYPYYVSGTTILTDTTSPDPYNSYVQATGPTASSCSTPTGPLFTSGENEGQPAYSTISYSGRSASACAYVPISGTEFTRAKNAIEYGLCEPVPQPQCEAEDGSENDAGGATWPATYINNTVTGTCINNSYSSTPPTRSCLYNSSNPSVGMWGAVSNSCKIECPEYTKTFGSGDGQYTLTCPATTYGSQVSCKCTGNYLYAYYNGKLSSGYMQQQTTSTGSGICDNGYWLIYEGTCGTGNDCSEGYSFIRYDWDDTSNTAWYIYSNGGLAVGESTNQQNNPGTCIVPNKTYDGCVGVMNATCLANGWYYPWTSTKCQYEFNEDNAFTSSGGSYCN